MDSEEQSLAGPDDEEPSESTTDENEKEQESESESRSQPKSIRGEWPNHSFYLPEDEIADDLNSQFKKLDWELSDEYSIDIKKTRHYYPLIVDLGLE